MGMFDYVKYKAKCRKCKKPLSDFQSKDGECLMSTLEPEEVDVFYTNCDHCDTWNEFDVVKKTIKIIHTDRDHS